MRLMKLAQDAVDRAISGKGVFARELVVGEQVVHTTSGVRGVLEGVEVSGGNVLLTIRTPTGQVLSKLARQEFRLCSEAPAIPIARPVAPTLSSRAAPEAANKTKESAAEPEVDLKIDCSEGISSASILDEP
jgi:hypothetical protein